MDGFTSVEGDYAQVSSMQSSLNDTHTLLQPIVGEGIKKVGHVNTIWAAFFLVLLLELLGAAVIISPFLWTPQDGRECESYFYVLYLQTGYWVLAFLFDSYFRRKHTESRIEGFLEFYESIVKFSRAPFVIISSFTAVLLGLAAFFHHHFGLLVGYCNGDILDPLLCISVLVIIEVIIVTSVVIVYMVKIHQFNRRKAPPDALRDEWMATFIRDSYSGGEVGYRERDNHIDDLLERQADLIRYLKDQNGRLVQKILNLSIQLQDQTPNIL